MDVSVDGLRSTYSCKTSDELRRIAGSAPGEYTPEAVSMAQEVLASRPSVEEGREAPGGDNGSRGQPWAGAGATLAGLYFAKQVFYQFCHAEINPQAVTKAVRVVSTNPWTYVCIAPCLVWLLRRNRTAA